MRLLPQLALPVFLLAACPRRRAEHTSYRQMLSEDADVDMDESLTKTGVRSDHSTPAALIQTVPPPVEVSCASNSHLATPAVAARAKAEHIHLEQRFSDHAPLVIDHDFDP